MNATAATMRRARLLPLLPPLFSGRAVEPAAGRWYPRWIAVAGTPAEEILR